ncbi:MAG TPA: VOC family protein [Verrucomicrobiae bacterium]|nr:VOC family protein [Verrucomicrobiae bacterium]
MVKFDHMMLPVSDAAASRDWYVDNLGFRIECENRQSGTVAIQDDNGFTIFLQKTAHSLSGEKCSLTIQVKDVDQTHRDLAAKGVAFRDAPKRYFWGYGAELLDPDGYLIRLWDEVSMREKGSA